MSLRILVISLEYPPPAAGGYEVMCAQVSAWLCQHGHALLVLCAGNAGNISNAITTDAAHAMTDEDGTVVPPHATEIRDGVLVRRTLRSYWDGEDCIYPRFRDALAIERANQAQLRDALATFRPDVVMFWHMGALSLGLITTAARLGLPIVFVIGDDWLCYGGWADAWLRRFSYHPQRTATVERLTDIPTRLPDLDALATFCFVSDFTRRRAEQLGGWRFRRSIVAYPGVNPAEFPPLTGPLERERQQRPWRWRLLWIGRVIAAKGVETAILALAALPREATLEIVGPTTHAFRAELNALARATGVADRLRFARVPHIDVRDRYLSADVTLFTSNIEHEAFGLVPLEAMASGCPVICTGVGGSAEYCQHAVNCLGIPPADPAALAAAIQRLAADLALRRHLVEGGLRTAVRFSLERQARIIEQHLYAEISAHR